MEKLSKIANYNSVHMNNNQEEAKSYRKAKKSKVQQGMLNGFLNVDTEKPVPKDFDTSTVKIWSWNINGIRQTMSKNIIQDFFKEYDPQILCINETKIDEDSLNRKNLCKNIPEEYIQFWN